MQKGKDNQTSLLNTLNSARPNNHGKRALVASRKERTLLLEPPLRSNSILEEGAEYKIETREASILNLNRKRYGRVRGEKMRQRDLYVFYDVLGPVWHGKR